MRRDTSASQTSCSHGVSAGPGDAFLRGRQSSLVASLVALCVFAGHELFTVVATACPCSPGRNPALAGLSALGPALLLLLAGLAVNNHTQRSLAVRSGGCLASVD
uniref:Calcium homeostasis modulator protein 2-like n=1 Tax=Petromyzon marinus TaxID=7757 RepID=A0AAJ7SJS4_PETMA|nr:calcium homeostasis modulator protein 2-like [Petromyzon marinus]